MYVCNYSLENCSMLRFWRSRTARWETRKDTKLWNLVYMRPVPSNIGGGPNVHRLSWRKCCVLILALVNQFILSRRSVNTKENFWNACSLFRDQSISSSGEQILRNVARSKEPLISFLAFSKHKWTICCFYWKRRFVITGYVEMGVSFMCSVKRQYYEEYLPVYLISNSCHWRIL